MAGLDVDAVVALYDAVVSHAMAVGLFSNRVTDHEPLNPPSTGLSCAVLLGPLVPLPRASGLRKTSGRLEFHVRVYSPAPQLPAAGIDRGMLKAVATLMAAYSADFSLVTGSVAEGLVNMIDLLGAYGTPLSAQPGWLTQDSVPFRVTDIVLPLILNDMWSQAS
jgi:hypothetical protein